MLYILTGRGKGKTTCALGMGVRAVGAGKKVLLVQFLKTGNSSSENKTIKKIKKFVLKSFGQKHFILPPAELKNQPQLKKLGVKPSSEKDFQLAHKGFNFAKKAAESRKYNLLILDEINLVLHFGLINKKEILDFLKKYQKKLDIVLTGRYCPKEIVKIADLVTEFTEQKHYYEKGKKPKKGIDY